MGILQWLGITGPVDPFEDYLATRDMEPKKKVEQTRENKSINKLRAEKGVAPTDSYNDVMRKYREAEFPCDVSHFTTMACTTAALYRRPVNGR